jgi:hypothetical protein
VVDPGDTILTLAALGTSSVDLDAAPLVDRLIHLILNDTNTAVVAVGDVVIGDGSQARVSRNDIVIVQMGVKVGLDFTIPAGGVTFTRNTTQTGMELDPEDADNLAELVDSAVVATEVVNNTPFGVVIDFAFVEGSLGEDVDIFAEANAVVISIDTLPAPTVNASGEVTTPSEATVTAVLTGTQARPLAGETFSATVRARLLPSTGGTPPGRGAIRATDEIEVKARARIVLRTGGGGQ